MVEEGVGSTLQVEHHWELRDYSCHALLDVPLTKGAAQDSAASGEGPF